MGSFHGRTSLLSSSKRSPLLSARLSHVFRVRFSEAHVSPSDRRLCERQVDGRLDTAGVLGHPGEHGAQQPQPFPAGQTGNHHGEAHCSPAGVSSLSRNKSHSLSVCCILKFKIINQHHLLSLNLAQRYSVT